jgi:MoaA/NifB/PqqE/SkfB family radical SAM enzyme
MKDYIFRYRLEQLKTKARISSGRSMLVPGELLRSLLDILVPCTGDEEVQVDGFKLLNNRSVFYRLSDYQQSGPLDSSMQYHKRIAKDTKGAVSDGSSYQDIKNAALYMPVIELIKKQLESILAVVDMESEGKPIKIDGFRLKDLNDWVLHSSCDPSEIMDHAGTRCNCNCVFCYNKGAPPSLALRFPQRNAAEEFEEMKTRLKYYKPEAERTLFPSLGSTCEVLAHPHAIEVFKALRIKTDKTIRVITNGAALTERKILQLAELKPVYLDISLGSANYARRQTLMRDDKPKVAINSLPLLKAAGIPYSVILVPWPLKTEKEMLQDLEKTILCAADNDVHLIQVSLPGYTKYFSPAKLFDLNDLWTSIVVRIKDLRKQCDCPIVVMPGLYEEHISRPQKNVPEVIGVVRNSPAFLAGMRPGDIIRRIAGSSISNRPQARDILSIIQQGEFESVPLTIIRDKREICLEIDTNIFSYPYSKLTDTHLGFIFMGTGLRLGYLEKLKEIIDLHKAKNILFLSSTLVKSVFEQCLKQSYFFSDVDLKIGVPENRFFGGNIFMGDLLVVDDFIFYIKKFLKEVDKKPDLLVIPSTPFSLSQWGRDLTGRCYLDIEREVGIPVELLECNTIYD